MTRIARTAVASFALLALAAACRDATAPIPSAEGTYVATTFLTGTSSAAARDLLAAGGSYSLTLGSGGHMTSVAEVPGSISGDTLSAGPSELEVTGLWGQDGSTVTIVDPFAALDAGYSASHFTVRGDSLTAEETANGAYVKIVLHRQ